MQNRIYQTKTIEELTKFSSSNEVSMCLMLPTGGGKTYVASEFIFSYLLNRPKSKVLVCVHRIELMEQFAESVRGTGLIVDTIEAGKRNTINCDVYVGMIETIKKRKLHGSIDLTIIDECHIGNFKKMIPKLKQMGKLIGLSATPVSANKQDPLVNYFDRLFIGATIYELMEQGYLSNDITYVNNKINFDKFNVIRGEYDTKQMSTEYSKQVHVKHTVDSYWKYGKGLKTIIFNVDIAHNDNVFEEFKNDGLNVRKVDSCNCTKQERKDTFDWFRTTDDAILCNVGIATTGLDVPDIECGILNRTTKSLPLFLQMVGRLARVTLTKSEFVLIDLGGNSHHKLHGYWAKDRDWKSLFNLNVDKVGGVPPSKICKVCNFLNHSSVTKCKECGALFPVKPIQEAKEIELKLIKNGNNNINITVNIHALIGVCKRNNFKPNWIVFNLAKALIRNIETQSERKMQYPLKSGYIKHQIEDFLGNKWKYVEIELGAVISYKNVIWAINEDLRKRNDRNVIVK